MRTALLVLLVAATSLAQDAPVPQTVTVTGTGSAKVVPDRVSFTVGVSTEKASVRESFTENNAKTGRVVAALRALGVTDTEIQTSNFSIHSPYDPRLERENPSRFVVTNSVTVTRQNPEGVSDLLQAAVDAGANQAGQLNFFVADPTAGRDEALDRAYRDAQAQAARLAAAAKRSLGDVVSITAVPMMRTPYDMNVASEAIAVTGGGPAIETGVARFHYSVMVTYDLR